MRGDEEEILPAEGEREVQRNGPEKVQEHTKEGTPNTVRRNFPVKVCKGGEVRGKEWKEEERTGKQEKEDQPHAESERHPGEFSQY